MFTTDAFEIVTAVTFLPKPDKIRKSVDSKKFEHTESIGINILFRYAEITENNLDRSLIIIAYGANGEDFLDISQREKLNIVIH